MNNTYWSSNGKYQAWYDELWKQVPAQGKADKLHIDLVRCVSKLYYDHYNNGGCNWDIYRNSEFTNLGYWQDVLYPVALEERDGTESLQSDFTFIRKTMDEIERMDDRAWIKEKLDSLDDKWEKLTDIIVRYAWEKEHGLGRSSD